MAGVNSRSCDSKDMLEILILSEPIPNYPPNDWWAVKDGYINQCTSRDSLIPRQSAVVYGSPNSVSKILNA